MSLRSSQPRQRSMAGPAQPPNPRPPPRRGPSELRQPPRQGLTQVNSLVPAIPAGAGASPQVFYAGLAEDAADQLARHIELAGRTVVDVGGGAGHFTAAFRARGANCYLFEPDSAELLSAGEAPVGAVLADGYWLPVADASADVCFSSNVLEHVADPAGLIDEMIRATKPGGVIYLSFTNWYSPWGGHEMSPWHLLGAELRRAAIRQRATAASRSTASAATCTGSTSGRSCGSSGRGRMSRSSTRCPVTTPGGAGSYCAFPWSGSWLPGTLLVIARRTA